MKMRWPHLLSIGRECNFNEGVAIRFFADWRPGKGFLAGDYVYIGPGCDFNIASAVEIGAKTMIGAGSKFIDNDHGSSSREMPMNEQPIVSAPIVIGEACWIGSNVVILKGVSIGDGAIIGAGSVVTKSVPSFEIWAGVPAKRIGERP